MFYTVHTSEGPYMTVNLDGLCQLIRDAEECIVWVEASENPPAIR